MRKIAFLFPGQGCQYVGMGKTFYDKFPLAKDVFDEAEKILGYDIKKICFEGPFEKLTEPEYIQPAILTASLAAFRVFEKEIGVKPDVLLGHSFGELSALTCAGVITFEDALKIAKLKGEYSQEVISGLDTTMSIIKELDAKEVRKGCEEVSEKDSIVTVGIVNSKNQVVIAGHTVAVKKVEELMQKKGGVTDRLRVRAPFHSEILDEATKKIEKDLRKIEYKKFKLPVLSSMNAEFYKEGDDEEIIYNLSKSSSKEVLWIEPVEKLAELGINTTIEIGPQKILTNLMPDIVSGMECFTFNKFIDLEPLKKVFSLDSKGKEEIIVRCLRVSVCVKNNNWDNGEYEEGVVAPYREVKNNLLKARKEEKELSMENVIEALQMVDSVFNTKKVEVEEREERICEIFENEYEAMRKFFKVNKKLSFL